MLPLLSLTRIPRVGDESKTPEIQAAMEAAEKKRGKGGANREGPTTSPDLGAFRAIHPIRNGRAVPGSQQQRLGRPAAELESIRLGGSGPPVIGEGEAQLTQAEENVERLKRAA